MKLINQLEALHTLYIKKTGKIPDMVIMDEGVYDWLLEEVKESGLPIFLEDVSITVVTIMEKAEVRFYKRSHLLKLKARKVVI